MEKLTIDNCYNCDCKDLMQAMKEQGIKADWCITDVPYGIGADEFMYKKNGQRNGKSKVASRIYEKKDWDSVRIGGGTSTL